MKKIVIILLALVVVSCVEKLIEKPDNLIPRDKMIAVLKDMAILNAGKATKTNIRILKENGIEPTQYLFEKHDIDSTVFVESDRYYASLPLQYVSMYEEIEALLTKEKKLMDEAKKISDSIKVIELQKLRKKNDSIKEIPVKISSDQK
ncbi:MAG: hypothetical protein ACJART_000990 [Maribacter sp.]|jgi:hypothetical protein|tara:strand:+ start:735 stop:1178 length:444 start_codon:yes stop_codon:yes gene_type:complete